MNIFLPSTNYFPKRELYNQLKNKITFHFSPAVKYRTSHFYSDLSSKAFREHFSDIPHTINTAFPHHQLSFFDLSMPSVKASELRRKEKWHRKSITFTKMEFQTVTWAFTAKLHSIIHIDPTLNSQAAIFLKPGLTSSNLSLVKESS